MAKPEFQTDEEFYADQHGAPAISVEDRAVLFQKAKDQFNKAIQESSISPEKIKNGGPEVTAQVRAMAAEVYRVFNEQALSRNTPRLPMSAEEFVQDIEYGLLGMGPLEPLLRDETVEDIVINGINEIKVKKTSGDWETTDVRFSSEMDLIELLNRGMASSGQSFNPVKPIADAELPGGQRISVAMNPVSNFPVASIRCHRARNITFKDMVAGQLMSQAAADYLTSAIVAGLNIVYVGATGSGKTTMINASGRELKMNPKTKDYRIIVIENTREIDIMPDSELPENIVYLRSRLESIDHKTPAVPEDALVILSLRQRPDGLTLGEARGGEILPLLQALSTGHRNGMTSIHANSIEESFDRMLIMLNMSEQGRKITELRAAKLVSLAFNVLVFIKKDPNVKAGRSVQAIAEYTGKVVEKDGIPYPELSILFERRKGQLVGPLCPTCHEEKFREANVDPTPFLKS